MSLVFVILLDQGRSTPRESLHQRSEVPGVRPESPGLLQARKSMQTELGLLHFGRTECRRSKRPSTNAQLHALGHAAIAAIAAIAVRWRGAAALLALQLHLGEGSSLVELKEALEWAEGEAEKAEAVVKLKAQLGLSDLSLEVW